MTIHEWPLSTTVALRAYMPRAVPVQVRPKGLACKAAHLQFLLDARPAVLGETVR